VRVRWCKAHLRTAYDYFGMGAGKMNIFYIIGVVVVVIIVAGYLGGHI